MLYDLRPTVSPTENAIKHQAFILKTFLFYNMKTRFFVLALSLPAAFPTYNEDRRGRMITAVVPAQSEEYRVGASLSRCWLSIPSQKYSLFSTARQTTRNVAESYLQLYPCKISLVLLLHLWGLMSRAQWGCWPMPGAPTMLYLSTVIW